MADAIRFEAWYSAPRIERRTCSRSACRHDDRGQRLDRVPLPSAASCETIDVEYAVVGRLRVTGTLFGAPPKGTSPVHVGPNAVELEPFAFDVDLTTFTMPYTLVSETETPKQRSFVALSGRATQRTCVRPVRKDFAFAIRSSK